MDETEMAIYRAAANFSLKRLDGNRDWMRTDEFFIFLATGFNRREEPDDLIPNLRERTAHEIAVAIRFHQERWWLEDTRQTAEHETVVRMVIGPRREYAIGAVCE